MAEMKHQIPIKTSPAKAYAAIATPAGLKTADTNAEERVGGKAEFGFDRRSMVFRMKVEKLEPGKLVVWSCQGEHPEWAGTTLTRNISNEGGVTHARRLEVCE